jgi:translation initiation factor 2 subunit 3
MATKKTTAKTKKTSTQKSKQTSASPAIEEEQADAVLEGSESPEDESAQPAASKKITKKKSSTAKKKASVKKSKKATQGADSDEAPKKKSKKASAKKAKPDMAFVQAGTNIGMVGHVDHGKTSLVKTLSGDWTERFSDEQERGITIRLGYADMNIYECPECGGMFSEDMAKRLKPKKAPKGSCPNDGAPLQFRRRISFVDAPGHESLMATMITGASLMDGALLLIAANEPCPQPQTREHLAGLEISQVQNIIIVQNKVDAVTKERALEHFHEIKAFVQGTIAENAPIIPVSAIFDANTDLVVKAIEQHIPTPEHDEAKPLLFHIARSFDVNRPGSEISDLIGGVIGGSVEDGVLSVGDEIEILPGVQTAPGVFTPVNTKVVSIFEERHPLQQAGPGGLIAIGTELDPNFTKNNNMIGNVAGHPGKLPKVLNSLHLKVDLLTHVLGSEEMIQVQPLRTDELIMLIVKTTTTAGKIGNIKGKKAKAVPIDLVRPICAQKGELVAIERRIENRWRLIGYGTIV